MATVCSGCGTREADWDTDPDAFIGDLRFCKGCERRGQEEGNIPKDADGRDHPGWHIRLVTKAFARLRARELADKDGPGK